MKLCFGFGNSLGIPKAIFAGVRLKIAAKLTAIFAVARFGKRFDIPDRFSRPKGHPAYLPIPTRRPPDHRSVPTTNERAPSVTESGAAAQRAP
jgi:hypothetical protein